MDINYADPLSGLATCEEKDRGKLFDFIVGAMGRQNAIHSFIDHKLHINPDGSIRKISEMTGDFRGLIPFQTFLTTLRNSYPSLFREIKEASGHLHG